MPPTRRARLRWRIESNDFVISSHSYPAPAGLVTMGYMMNFQIGLGAPHLTAGDNSGLCTHRCEGVTIQGATSCERPDCNSLPPSSSLIHAANSSIHHHLMASCGAVDHLNTRSPCDPPVLDEACRATGFSLQQAQAACAPLAAAAVTSATAAAAYDGCLYDCCVTADREFCVGLAQEAVIQTDEFEEELIHDGRFR